MSTLARVALLLAIVLFGLVLAGPKSHAAVVKPPTPVGLPVDIEPMTSYVEQTSCDPTVKPGTQKLGDLLARTYPGISWSSAYQCGDDGRRSEHYEGRAIDWMVSARSSSQKATASAVISWLLATDSRGNKNAIARRLGVMYVIFNNQIWGTWSGAWEPYHDCATHLSVADDGRCHRNHMHISLSWNGALGKTTFWTKTPSVTDYGPCREADMNWAATRTVGRETPCPKYATVNAPAGASTTLKNLIAYSGAGLHLGNRGAAVRALQAGIKVPVTGVFDLVTQTKVLAIQAAHGLTKSGGMRIPTWRVVLASLK